MADPKSLADWLNTDSDSDAPKSIRRRKSSNAFAFQGMDGSTTSNHHHNRSTTRGRSPNAPSLTTDSPVMRRADSRGSLRRSSSRAMSVVGTIRGVAATSPSDPPLPSIDVNKARKQQEADERKRRMEEMKAKLRETLGDAADKVSMLKPQAEAVAIPKTVAASDDYSSDFGSHTNPLPSHLPPLSARSSMDFNRRAHLPAGHPSYGATPPRQVVVETEVMLADRGTQTACEVEVQTDPDPLVAACPQCYSEVYGHTHHNFYNCGHAGSMAVAAIAGHGSLGMQGDPVFAKLLASRMGSHVPMGYDAPQQQRYPAMMTMTAAPQQQDPWREQLSYIESSIDMLIKRYNLPPPPGMERYQPAR